MLKTKKDTILYILLIIVILLVGANIYFINEAYGKNEDVVINEEYVYEKVDGDFDSTKDYYIRINYSKFKKYFNGNNLVNIAIIDNSSNTYNKFLQTINKIAFYKKTNIYLLEISKLSNKNEIEFYEIDERFKDLSSNYIITVKDGKILAITTFENGYLNVLEEGIGE